MFHNTRLNPKACVEIENGQLKGNQSGVEMFLTSCTHFDV